MKITIMAAIAALSALAGAAQAHEPYPDRSAPPMAYGDRSDGAWMERERIEDRAAPREIHLSDSFFAGAGGVGPAFVESGGYGGDRVYVFGASGGRAFGHAFAFASAHASASAHVRIGGGHHGCGCH